MTTVQILIAIGFLVAARVVVILSDRGGREGLLFGTRGILREIYSENVESARAEGARIVDLGWRVNGLRRLSRWSTSALLVLALGVCWALSFILGVSVLAYAATIGAVLCILEAVPGLRRALRSGAPVGRSWLCAVLKAAVVFPAYAGLTWSLVAGSLLVTLGNLWGAAAMVLAYLWCAQTESFLDLVDRRWLWPRDYRLPRSEGVRVLYLRSFADDSLRIRSPHARGITSRLIAPRPQRFEELFVAGIAADGDAIAIGRPGERIPELGALRTYWPDSEWQSAVTSYAQQAEWIVVLAGRSDGVLWEIDHLRKVGLLEKTVIVLPPVGHVATHRDVVPAIWRLGIDAEFAMGLTYQAMAAIRFTERGDAVVYATPGRDWAAYATIADFISQLRPRPSTDDEAEPAR